MDRSMKMKQWLWHWRSMDLTNRKFRVLDRAKWNICTCTRIGKSALADMSPFDLAALIHRADETHKTTLSNETRFDDEMNFMRALRACFSPGGTGYLLIAVSGWQRSDNTERLYVPKGDIYLRMRIFLCSVSRRRLNISLRRRLPSVHFDHARRTVNTMYTEIMTSLSGVP